MNCTNIIVEKQNVIHLMLLQIKLCASTQQHKFPLTSGLGTTAFFFLLAQESQKLHLIPKQNDKIIQAHNH